MPAVVPSFITARMLHDLVTAVRKGFRIASQIIVAYDVRNAPNDKQQAEPLAQATLATLADAGIELPTDESGATEAIPATLDNGY